MDLFASRLLMVEQSSCPTILVSANLLPQFDNDEA
jgi:hypothetical protein